MTVLVAVETLLLAVLTVLVAGLLRAYGAVLRRLDTLDHAAGSGPRQFDLQPGSTAQAAPPSEFGPAHDVAGVTLSGEVVTTRVVGVEHDTLLLYSFMFGPEMERPCPMCTSLLEAWTDPRRI